MTSCACGSAKPYDECCGPFIAGTALPPTAEALMRSRYTAFTRADIAYLERTLAPEERKTFNVKEAEAWASQSEWLGLDINATVAGGEADTTGTVDFTAKFKLGGQDRAHHEIGTFRKDGGTWLYVDGKVGTKPVRREGPKVGRNDPCPCGSGKKHKVCCGR